MSNEASPTQWADDIHAGDHRARVNFRDFLNDMKHADSEKLDERLVRSRMPSLEGREEDRSGLIIDRVICDHS